MKDSINRTRNRKAQRERGTCDRLNKRHGETVGRREVRDAKSSSEIHAKSEAQGAVLLPRSASTLVRPKIRIST